MTDGASQQTDGAECPAPRSGRVRVGPAQVYYQEAGRDGPPVVLVHGLAGSSRWWRRNVRALARHFHVYVIDLIGFGRSRGRSRFVLSEAARRLRDWMDRVGIAAAHVVGHSMGGIIAVDLAARFPERVRRLALVNAAAFSFLDRAFVRSATGLAKTLWYLPFGFLPVLFSDALRAGPWLLWRAGRDLLTTDIRKALAQVAAPTLIVWGERDAMVPLEIGERLRDELAGAELSLIEKAGHNPMWDRPAAFNRVVTRFLQDDWNSERRPPRDTLCKC